MNRFGVTLHFQDVFFCGFVPLVLAVFSNFLLPMLNHSRGKKREFFWEKKPQQILEIFERFISNTPRLFNSFYPVGARLILLASWRGCKIYFSFQWLFSFDCLVVAASLEVSEILAKWKNLSVSLRPIYALLA